MMLTIPATEWLTSNMRLHWAEKARRTRAIRTRARWAAASAESGLEPRNRAAVVVQVSYPTNRRQDPANAAPSVKAAIDGLVDAGILPDDDALHLTAVTYRRGDQTGTPGWYGLTFTLGDA